MRSKGRKLSPVESLELEGYLEGNSLLNSSMLGPTGIEKLLKWARITELDANDTVFKKGDKIKNLIIVRSGFIHVSDKETGKGELLVSTGALLDAGHIKGSGKKTEKREEYITNAVVDRSCHYSELFVIDMKRYDSALNKLVKVTTSHEFKSLHQTALFHDLHHSDIMRIFNYCDLREYSPGSNIIRRNAAQSNRLYIIVSGDCVARDFHDSDSIASSHHDKNDKNKESFLLRCPAYFNEECLVRGVDNSPRKNINNKEVKMYSNHFRRKTVRRMKENKCMMTVKVGNRGCTLLTLSKDAFHDHCVDLSENFYSHFMRRLEDMDLASAAFTHVHDPDSSVRVGTPQPDMLDVGNTGGGQMAIHSTEGEKLHFKCSSYRNPERKDQTLFDSCPVLKVRVLKSPLCKSLIDVSHDQLLDHFNVMKHQDEIDHHHSYTQYDSDTQGEYCYMDMVDKIGNDLLEDDMRESAHHHHRHRRRHGSMKNENKDKLQSKAESSMPNESHDSSDKVAIINAHHNIRDPSKPSMLSSLFGESDYADEFNAAKKGPDDDGDDEYHNSAKSRDSHDHGVQSEPEPSINSEKSVTASALDLVTNPLGGIFSLVGVVPGATEDTEEVLEEKSPGAAVEEVPEVPGAHVRRFTSTSPVALSQIQAGSRKNRGSIARVRLEATEDGHDAGVTFAEDEDGNEEGQGSIVGSNFLFGIFDTVLCNVPEVLCGEGNPHSQGSGNTPVA